MLEWTPTLATGHPEIDRQHQEIFAKLNGIEVALNQGADRECLIRLMTALMDYAYIHFHHEENAMRCSRCPFQDNNCDAHRGFIIKLHTWMATIMSGEAPDSLFREIHEESCRWLLNHIAKVDIGLLQKTA